VTARVLYVDRYFESPYAMSAFVALEEKGLDYALAEIALERREQDAPDYGARTGRIPALVDGDFWLAESSAIAEYLDEAYPPPAHPPLYPNGVKERAICREVQAWLRSDLGAIREERPTTSLFVPGQRATKPLSDAATRASARLVAAFERLVPTGATSLFAAWCIADTDLALMLMRLHGNGDPLPAGCARYAEAQWARASVHAWVAQTRPTPYVPH
jgi:glutathione S-transferase